MFDIPIKLLGIGLFIAFIYFTVDAILAYIMLQGLPVLPENVRYLGTKACIFTALNTYIKIVIYGFIAKQIIGYVRSL